ncbi:MAG: efflux RND transporter periplasmic adaptor subunit [Rhodocyclaceae bacterium]|nr:efflux RND transporter periplasmic adaptor subunit [Rhodocyclaceae bacterium]MBK6555381.1 efflux RND transporter periplasmic adaptor subunit [Rhodocyclaceae bacterium]MBK6676711.1 efflux RND transporter periplasmic adaptor subunit [Rhodocyclaceae bacterium]MBK9955570.1 efflux RND transporter periplasmic adaptor subunit [Rhodocyclaceae bacterium]
MKRRAFFLAFAIALIAAAYGGYRYFATNGKQTTYKFATVESGPLTAAVSAAGTLNPVSTVQVGSQISGQIKEILVDFNSPVKAGQLVARIDPETYRYKLRQTEADLEATRSAVNVQRALAYQAQVNLAEAQRDFDRKSLLLSKNFISPADRDKARTTLDGAIAQVRLTEAQVKNSESVVGQREAQVAQAKVDLGRTEIRSPVDGIVVKRSVEPGQTVAASLQAPELFVIARNLSDMQVETSIDEADVGRVAIGQRANFTVDAFPQRRFEGEVRQVRKAATVVSNVVTYTVIVTASNDDLMLLPGMTANVRIVTAKKDKVLKVANAVLRFKPESEKDAAKVSPGGTPAGGAGGPGKRGKPPSQVWALDEGGKPKAIPIETGITDGTATEITAGDVREGMEVIVGATAPAKPATPGGPRMF